MRGNGATKVSPLFPDLIVVDQALAGRAMMEVIRRQIARVLVCEPAFRLAAPAACGQGASIGIEPISRAFRRCCGIGPRRFPTS